MILPILLFMFAGTAERRAIDFLAHEVPRWQSENHCYSCHNNGDGARALYAARRAGHVVPESALADTTRWLTHPADWDHPGGTPGFNSASLARIQFAAALAEARGTELAVAARLLLATQAADGSWPIELGGSAGAPATYGMALATYMARHTLEAAGGAEFGGAIARANQWFLNTRPANLLDTAAFVLAMPRSAVIRKRYLATIREAKPVEPFDAAIVLMALHAAGEAKAAARVRASLIAQQQADGSWPETTRPPGQISYAEHISTTAWALTALLSGEKKRQ